MTTLTDIRNFMLSKLTKPTSDSEGDEYYDDDGYCGNRLYKKIKLFWTKFSSDKDFEYLVTARWASDELDLSGGRSYLLSFEELIDMCFDYMYKTLKWSSSDYDSRIFNSCDFTYEILGRYDNLAVKRDEKLNQVSKGIEDVLENTSANDLGVLENTSAEDSDNKRMKIFKHEGPGFYIGSCVIVTAEDINAAEALIRKQLSSMRLADERLEIVEVDASNGIIYSYNGESC